MTTAELEDLLYAIGMESQEAWKHMEELCKLLGVEFPPKSKDQ